MPCSQCVGVERRFGRGMARRELKRYRRRGPGDTTRRLLDTIVSLGVEGRTFLDIGGGVGAIQHELLKAGAARGASVDAAPAYVAAARGEAERLGLADRMTYREGDFVELQPELDEADVVTLDRVICCYHDMPSLVDRSAERARRAWAAVVPRDRASVRFGVWLVNALHWLARHPFRAYVHSPGEIRARLEARGFEQAHASDTFVWHVLVYIRPAADRTRA